MIFILRTENNLVVNGDYVNDLEFRLVCLPNIQRRREVKQQLNINQNFNLWDSFNEWAINYNKYYPANATCGDNLDIEVIVEPLTSEQRQIDRKNLSRSSESVETIFTQVLRQLDEITNEIKVVIQKNNKIKHYSFLIQTDNIFIRRLPWHFYTKEIEDYIYEKENRKINIGLGFIDKNNVSNLKIIKTDWISRVTKSFFHPIKVQVVVGEGIDHLKIKKFIQELIKEHKGWLQINKTIYASQSNSLAKKLEDRDFGILIYLGHSSSKYIEDREDISLGKIIYSRDNNENIEITLKQLKSVLENPKSHRLLIFNSCKGLGLAKDICRISSLSSNTSCVVMKEPLMDGVALNLIKSLLSNLKKYEKLDLAIKKTQEDLFGDDSRYPCASWLPALCLSSSSGIPLVDIFMLKSSPIIALIRRPYLSSIRIMSGWNFGVYFLCWKEGRESNILEFLLLIIVSIVLLILPENYLTRNFKTMALLSYIILTLVINCNLITFLRQSLIPLHGIIFGVFFSLAIVIVTPLVENIISKFFKKV